MKASFGDGSERILPFLFFFESHNKPITRQVLAFLVPWLYEQGYDHFFNEFDQNKSLDEYVSLATAYAETQPDSLNRSGCQAGVSELAQSLRDNKVGYSGLDFNCHDAGFHGGLCTLFRQRDDELLRFRNDHMLLHSVDALRKGNRFFSLFGVNHKQGLIETATRFWVPRSICCFAFNPPAQCVQRFNRDEDYIFDSSQATIRDIVEGIKHHIRAHINALSREVFDTLHPSVSIRTAIRQFSAKNRDGIEVSIPIRVLRDVIPVIRPTQLKNQMLFLLGEVSYLDSPAEGVSTVFLSKEVFS